MGRLWNYSWQSCQASLRSGILSMKPVSIFWGCAAFQHLKAWHHRWRRSWYSSRRYIKQNHFVFSKSFQSRSTVLWQEKKRKSFNLCFCRIVLFQHLFWGLGCFVTSFFKVENNKKILIHSFILSYWTVYSERQKKVQACMLVAELEVYKGHCIICAAMQIPNMC